MSTDLEQQLRIELRDDARRARLGFPDAPPTPNERNSTSHRTDVESMARRRLGGAPVDGRSVPPRRRTLAAVAAAAVIVIGVAAIALVNRPTSDDPLTTALATDRARLPSGSRRAEITWYAPEAADSSTVAADELVCRAPRDDGGCDELAGRRTAIHRTRNGQIHVITEYGPAESTLWQELARSGEEVDLDGYPGFTIPGNDELVGFIASSDMRVVLGGEADTNPAELVSALTTHREVVDVPVVFGDAVASDEEFPRDGAVDGVAARYYAGYIDTTADQPCVGGVGVPWNTSSSCVPVEPDTLTVTVATPSPTGTILIATLPIRTATAVVTGKDDQQRDLDITDAPDAGLKLVFADLDGFLPRELVAFDQHGAEIARTPITNGATPLGYLPVGDGN